MEEKSNRLSNKRVLGKAFVKHGIDSKNEKT